MAPCCRQGGEDSASFLLPAVRVKWMMIKVQIKDEAQRGKGTEAQSLKNFLPDMLFYSVPLCLLPLCLWLPKRGIHP